MRRFSGRDVSDEDSRGRYWSWVFTMSMCFTRLEYISPPLVSQLPEMSAAQEVGRTVVDPG